ncbi:16816_t:CDS:2, partial [Gigaspora rosea]
MINNSIVHMTNPVSLSSRNFCLRICSQLIVHVINNAMVFKFNQSNVGFIARDPIILNKFDSKLQITPKAERIPSGFTCLGTSEHKDQGLIEPEPYASFNDRHAIILKTTPEAE